MSVQLESSVVLAHLPLPRLPAKFRRGSRTGPCPEVYRIVSPDMIRSALGPGLIRSQDSDAPTPLSPVERGRVKKDRVRYFRSPPLRKRGRVRVGAIVRCKLRPNRGERISRGAAPSRS